MATDFQQIDDTAWQADRIYDTGLIKDAHDNTDACHTKRGRCAVYHAGDIDSSNNRLLPRICSFRRRALMPFIWHLAPDVTELEVVVRHTTPSNVTGSGTEMTISAVAIPFSQATADVVAIPPATGSATVDVDNNASAENTSLTVDVSGLPRGWCVVFLGFESGEDSTGDIIQNGAGLGPPVLDGWDYAYLDINSGVDSSFYTTDEIPCQGLELEDSSTNDRDGRLPDFRQILAVELAGSDFRLYVYPGFEVRSSGDVTYDDSTDQARKFDLGYIDLISVMIRDKTISSFPGLGGADKDAGWATANRVPQTIYRNALNVWGKQTRIHHIGPSHDPSDEDSNYSGQPYNLLGCHRQLSIPTFDGYRTLARAVVGYDGQYTYNGTTYYRTTYKVRALVLMTHGAGDFDREYLVNWRLILTDLDASTNQATGVTTDQQMTCHGIGVRSACKQRGSGGAGRVNAYLRDFHLRGTRGTRRRHALRGLVPIDAWASGRVQAVELEITDDATDAYRLLSLQAQGATIRFADGVRTITDDLPTVHLLTWTVMTAAPSNPVDAATSLGTT